MPDVDAKKPFNFSLLTAIKVMFLSALLLFGVVKAIEYLGVDLFIGTTLLGLALLLPILAVMRIAGEMNRSAEENLRKDASADPGNESEGRGK